MVRDIGHCLLCLPVVAVLIGHQNGGVLPLEHVGVLEPVRAAAECGVSEHGVALQLSLQDFRFPDDSIVIFEETPHICAHVHPLMVMSSPPWKGLQSHFLKEVMCASKRLPTKVYMKFPV